MPFQFYKFRVPELPVTGVEFIKDGGGAGCSVRAFQKLSLILRKNFVETSKIGRRDIVVKLRENSKNFEEILEYAQDGRWSTLFFAQFLWSTS